MPTTRSGKFYGAKSLPDVSIYSPDEVNTKFQEEIQKTHPDLLLCKALIDAGADLNLQDKIGWTALMYACESNSSSTEQAVKMIIDAGADLNIQTEEGVTALMIASYMASMRPSYTIPKMLIDAGADLNIQSKSGDTALMCASYNYSISTDYSEQVMKLLIYSGADIKKVGTGGETAFHIALRMCDTSTTKRLVNMLVDLV